MLFAAIHDPDLVAIGGLAAAVATIILAIFAGIQMKAARDQVETMRTSAAAQVAALKESTEKELELVREQIDAATAGNFAVRDSARAQLQPIVFAHAFGSPQPGGVEDMFGHMIPEGRFRVGYYLANEGVGPALDVEHGISIGEVEVTINDEGYRYRTIPAGESLPPRYPEEPILEALAVDVLDPGPRLVYWTRFSNVFGDRFEVLNYLDASRPAVFRPLKAD